MYGSAWRNGELLADVVSVTGTVDVNRIEVPLVGTANHGFKAGREQREGSLHIQKIDAAWESELLNFMSSRTPVGAAYRTRTKLRTFDLTLRLDDPEAWGYEEWFLQGCQIWRIPVGFNITDDIIDNEFPLTWAAEQLRVGPDGAATPVNFTQRSQRLKADAGL